MTVFFDLETIPADESVVDLVREQFERRSARPSSYPKKEVTFEDYLHGTSLDPNFGRILCIGYAVDDAGARILHTDSASSEDYAGASEKKILEQFWDLAKGADRIVGHNAVSFDVPFLWKRSILRGVQPTLDLTDDQLIIDTMLLWDMKMPRKHTSLDLLAKLLGIPSSKTVMTGSEVYDFYRVGRLKEIYDYCQRDVVTTRAIYRKLTFLT